MGTDIVSDYLAGKIDPDALRLALIRDECERSLYRFVRRFWSVLHPGRPFVEGPTVGGKVQPPWSVAAICAHLEAVSRGEIKRLLINVPPGCMKSLVCSVFWPAWEWLRRPGLCYISASYKEALAIRDNRRCRMVVESDLYRAIAPHVELAADQSAKVRFDTTAQGFKIGCSIRSMTGERGDRVVIDDAHNVLEGESEAVRLETVRAFAESVPTRVTDDNAAIVLIGQRVHEEDCYAVARDLGYVHLCLEMERQLDHPENKPTAIGFVDPRAEEGELLWPERFPRAAVEEIKDQMRAMGGTYAEAAQLDQRPAPRGGGMFQRDDFEYVDRAPAGGDVWRGWDLAASVEPGAAYTAGVLIRRAPDGRFYVEDARRGHLKPGAVEDFILATAREDGPTVPISIPQDPGQAGKSQKRALAALLAGFRVTFSPETGDKVTRAKPFAAQCEGGNVFLVRGPWNRDFVSELVSFPAGKRADQVDAVSRSFGELIRSRPRHRLAAPITFVDGQWSEAI